MGEVKRRHAMKQQPDEQLLARYLLGDLPEDEQTRLEDRAFSEPEYLLTLQAIEKDLIDEYVRGELTGSEQRKFEEYFLASDGRRRKVEFARALAQVSAEYSAAAGRAANASPRSAWESLPALLRRRNLALRFSFAALVLLLLVAGLWIIRERRQSQTEQARNPPTPKISPPVQVNKEVPTPEEFAHNVATPTPAANKPIASPEESRAVIASLLLLPGTSRGSENPPQLFIPAAATSAQLRIAIESGEPYKHFRVELRSSAGKPISTHANLQANPSRTGRIISWIIPANLLEDGLYELALSGVNEQGQLEAIGYYYFKVVKP